MNNNRLYIGLNEGPDMFANLTVNIDAPCPEYCAYVDTNNLSTAEEFIKDNELGEFSGFTAVSGYHEYPLYTFDPDRLREIDPDGMRCYEQINGLGAGVWKIQRTGMEMIRIVPSRREVPALAFLAVTGIGLGIVNLLFRVLLSTGYQEEMIETNILDYMENRNREVLKTNVKQNVREFSAGAAGAGGAGTETSGTAAAAGADSAGALVSSSTLPNATSIPGSSSSTGAPI